MIVYRLSRKKYDNHLNGIGAKYASSNRWNSKGTEIIYTAASRALAMAEVLVHINIHDLPNDFIMVEIYVPENLPAQSITESQLSQKWAKTIPGKETQRMGDQLIRQNKYVSLRVPSAVVRGDFNFLLNPFHAKFQQVKILNITDFPFDDRLL